MAKFCANCGSPLDGAGKFCPSCGAQVMEEAVQATENPQSNRQEMKNSPMQATVASARKTKAEMPMPKVMQQASKNTQQKIQIPLKPDAQSTEKK